MGDTKNQSRKSHTRLPSASDGDEVRLTAGSSGSTLLLSSSKNGLYDDEDDKTLLRTRRSRSSSVKDLVLNNKLSAHDSDTKASSPSGPSAYLSSVRNNLTSDNAASPMNDKNTINQPNFNNNGNSSGYKLLQKRRSRLQESGNHHKPAEVFRKDLISAMKIPDTSQLLAEEYWVMRDSWRMEWEKGVQVPVNPDSLPSTKVEVVPKDTKGDFRMPRKLIKTTPDVGDRDTVNLNILADSICRYDLDEVDVGWLEVINDERNWMGMQFLDEFMMEIIMEELETQCHENMQLAIKTKVGLGIEYDENIVCDVCRSPDCEEGNEMVFCDGCNLCVHQACYGILKVPDGSWLCKPCALGIRGSAVCILCGKKGGAMKSTKSGRKWAHMSCALWIPEINIADPERMEPITKISHIPSSRWSLLCNVCKERSIGACIQCSVKHCVTAYHVTCAMENGFDMITDCCSPNSAPIPGESAIVFRSYCQKHSKNYKRKLENSPGKKTEEERRTDRQKRIAELEEEFYTLVKSEGVANALSIPIEPVIQVMEYWKLKRKANFNRPLVTPKQEEGKALEEAAETGLQRRLRMFTHLRQDLERVRNLCYMIGKREKMKRSSVKTMNNVFLAQIHYLEYRMSHSSNFDPKLLLPNIPKFGMPHILERAKRESLELAKTKEWSTGNSPDPSSEILDDPEMEDQEPIRLPQPRSSMDVDAKPVEKSKETNKNRHKGNTRKNGLIADQKRLEKSEIRNEIIASAKNLDEKKKNLDGVKLKSGNFNKRIMGNTDSNLSNGDVSDSLDSAQETKQNKKSLVSDKKEKTTDSCNEDDFVSKRDSINRKRVRSGSSMKRDESDKPLDDRSYLDKHRKVLSSKSRRESKKREHESSSSESNRDTVKERQSNRRSRFSRPKLKKHDSLDEKGNRTKNKSGDSAEQRRSKGDLQSPLKKPDILSKDLCTSKKQTTSISDKEKVRRSSRRTDISNSDDSDANLRASRHQKTRMSISTETISETKRLGNKRLDDDRRKRALSSRRSSEKSSADENRKKLKLDIENSFDDFQSRRKSPRSKHAAISTDEDVPVKRSSSRKSSRSDENLSGKIQKKSLSKESSLLDKAKKAKNQEAKNGQGALAPSSGRRGSEVHDKMGDVEMKTKTKRRPSGQELVDPKRSETPDQNTLPSPSSNSKSPKYPIIQTPILHIDQPNPAFRAACLDISYGSKAPAPLRQMSTHRKSPESGSQKSSGLKWVSLVDDDADDSFNYPASAPTPKDQEGYRGDMDESDSDFQDLPHKQQHKKLSSKKRSSLNPGKHRTGIGQFGTKISDSSDDDFDISFMSHNSSTEKSTRQKLRTINNNANLEEAKQLSFVSDIPETSKGSKNVIGSKITNHGKNSTEPKNVKAVGGIQGALKSEREMVDHLPPFFPSTTDGSNSQDNFFDRAEQMKPFVNPEKPTPFVQENFVSPNLLDFHNSNTHFPGVSLFPYGAYNPWQMPGGNSLPSIISNQFSVPVFYQYPTSSQQPSIFERPSPPPMPDSTLSPESFMANSASVAVQASPRSNDQDTKLRLPVPANTGNHDPDNEWEVVQEGVEFQRHDDAESERRHRRKHKKKKKKKKRRRMLFPEGYESEKRDFSSPTSGPVYGAIVQRGESTQYDIHHSSPLTSEPTGSSARIESETEPKEVPRKLVLKINKKNLVMDESDKYHPKHETPDSSEKSEHKGLKLTFKKSDFGHILKKYKHRRKMQESRHRFSSYTVSSSLATNRNFPMRKERITNPGMLRRLGLDVNNLPDPTDSTDGIGRRALRERKPIEKGVESEEVKKKRSAQVRLRSRSTTVSKIQAQNMRNPISKTLGNPGMVQSTSSGIVVKRGRGRPRKIRPGEPPVLSVKKEVPAVSEQPKLEEQNRDMAKFAGWSTKTSQSDPMKPVQMLPRTSSTGSAASFMLSKPVLTGSYRNKAGAVAIRSFSTDSDHNSLRSSSPKDNQPARHWKKRKVHEHETQVHEQPDKSNVTDVNIKAPSESLGEKHLSTPVSKSKKSPRIRSDDQPIFPKVTSSEKCTEPLPSTAQDKILHDKTPGSSTDQKPKKLSLKLHLPPPVSSSKTGTTPSPSKEKSPRGITPTKPSPTVAKLSLPNPSDDNNHGNKAVPLSSSSLPSPSKPQAAKEPSPETTPHKTYGSDYNLGFALQTGPLNNFKIPKKMHQTSTDSKLPSDT